LERKSPVVALESKTVANYVSNILHKLQVADRKEARSAPTRPASRARRAPERTTCNVDAVRMRARRRVRLLPSIRTVARTPG
jgi:hypothetical protein